MKLINRIKRLIESDRVDISLDKIKEWGLCFHETKEITIRESLGHINKIKTLIHECIHFLFPEKTESQVLKLEEGIYKELSVEDFDVLSKFVRRLK